MVKVVVVDDAPLVRLGLQRMIRELPDMSNGDTVLDFGDPVEALERIGQERPDVVVLDIRMPGMTGIEMLKHIKNGSVDNDPDVLLYTSYDAAQYRDKCVRLGAVDVYDKMGGIQDLMDNLQRKIHERRTGHQG